MTKYKIWFIRRSQSLTEKWKEAWEDHHIFHFLSISFQALSNLVLPCLGVSFLVLEAEHQDQVCQTKQVCSAVRHTRVQDNINTIWCQPQICMCNLSHWDLPAVVNGYVQCMLKCAILPKPAQTDMLFLNTQYSRYARKQKHIRRYKLVLCEWALLRCKQHHSTVKEWAHQYLSAFLLVFLGLQFWERLKSCGHLGVISWASAVVKENHLTQNTLWKFNLFI